MSDELEEQALPKKSGGKATLVIALTVGLMVGAAAGSFIVGPLLADAPEAGPSDADCAAALAEIQAAGLPPAPGSVHTIANIVLNPAQSGGTRFLMASVGFGLTAVDGAEKMALRDAEIRDMVIRVLGSKSVAELSDLPTRAIIKDEMRAEAVKLVGEHALVDVYFPQFVIQ